MSLPVTDCRDTACRVPAVALKEEFIGAKVSGITGEGESVTKVSYFKGNDPSKWKSNISTYQLVNLGEIYEGVELKLKAHGNNVEKLLYVKPGVNPGQIKIRLSGMQPQEYTLEKGVGGLSVNEHGELEAETALGMVRFTKPIAYQEIDGKRVEVAVEYSIQKSAVGEQGSKGRKTEYQGSMEVGENSKPETHLRFHRRLLRHHQAPHHPDDERGV